MIFARRIFSAFLSPSVVAANLAPGHPSLVQPRLEQLILSPRFKITNKPTTRVYDWTISKQKGAPDGYYRDMLVVNGMGAHILTY